LIFYVFLDGVGLGKKDPDKNPFSRFSEGFLKALGGYPSSVPMAVTDANMGMPGLPQSATGQTAIWTGINPLPRLERHVSGFPTITLRKMIFEASVLKLLSEEGKEVHFSNCYTDGYLEHSQNKPKLVSASTLVQIATGKPLKSMEDLRNGKGLYMDLTHEILREVAKLSPDDPLFERKNPYEQGKSWKSTAPNADLLLFEYFLTDKAGHAMDWDFAKKCIADLEEFFRGLLDALNPAQDLLLVTSDHGNLEDLSTKVHTSNPVATLAYGKNAERVLSHIHSLPDIVPQIYSELDCNNSLSRLDRFRNDWLKV